MRHERFPTDGGVLWDAESDWRMEVMGVMVVTAVTVATVEVSAFSSARLARCGPSGFLPRSGNGRVNIGIAAINGRPPR